jgi:hypothetical protein
MKIERNSGGNIAEYAAYSLQRPTSNPDCHHSLIILAILPFRVANGTLEKGMIEDVPVCREHRHGLIH